MNQQPQNQALGASETARLFCTRISSAASAAGRTCTLPTTSAKSSTTRSWRTDLEWATQCSAAASSSTTALLCSNTRSPFASAAPCICWQARTFPSRRSRQKPVSAPRHTSLSSFTTTQGCRQEPIAPTLTQDIQRRNRQ